jgi:hypothetical protein
MMKITKIDYFISNIIGAMKHPILQSVIWMKKNKACIEVVCRSRTNHPLSKNKRKTSTLIE